ncbi:hypothetical protein [Truepera radiovictrix]|uniref:ATP-dependent DNA ligase family profile domain-containing protein n=1 Tax=Truepera radiovictrix (strain DSM 17093 / CIP 108686 / LMG 22925 / RQ-24) TaxID=649638 RepID=D7CT46_TRURR|nr:hypothetical protein [Truepera radiovictrix]ADI15509.1 hypothetical protein Trad_2400 [Truepera radiovictrix DSM 17093]WMT55940.1 hypothetical protein RCV51_07915 [Truepera radiovictrix]
MTLRRLFLLLSTLTFLAACNQSTDLPAAELEAQFGTPLNDSAEAVATDPRRGAVYVAGVDSADLTYPYESGGNIFLRRYNRDGTLVWRKRLVSTPGLGLSVAGLHTDASGNVYVGWSLFSDNGSEGAALQKFDPSGKQRYRVDIVDGLRDFELDAAGNAYVSGLNDHDGTIDRQRQFVRKYDARGVLVWARERVYDDYGEPSGVEVPTPQTLSPAVDGSLYVTGVLDGPVLTKYSRTGHVLWQRTLPRAFSHATVASVANDVYLVNLGRAAGQGGRVPVLKYDASGKRVLNSAFPSTEAVNPRAFRADAAGDLYLAGDLVRSSDTDLFVRKYTPALQTVWTYTPRLKGTREYASEVALTDSSSVFVVGATDGKVNGKNFGELDAFLLRLDSQGKRVWSR